jgi:N-acetylneuraminate synthase/sialic acid synthase
VRELTIRRRRIADDEPCYVIAELGSNHQGSVNTAVEMVKAAVRAGASAVKLQKRENATLYAPWLLNKPYDHEHSFGQTYGEHRAWLEFGRREFLKVKHEATLHEIACFATAFDEESADFLEDLGAPAYKIASGGLTDVALLTYVAHKGQPMIVSTGGGTPDDIRRAVEWILPINPRLALLQCTASYPCAFNELDLRVIETLRQEYPDVVIGWSCHVHNLSMAMAAYALGARIIEVHFTLNRSMKGTDHGFSMEPATLTKLVKDLDRLHVALGDGEKHFYDSERAPISKMRRTWTGDRWQITGSTSSTSMAPSVTPSDATTPEPPPIPNASPS